MTIIVNQFGVISELLRAFFSTTVSGYLHVDVRHLINY